jgi:hypothetical protein
LRENELKSPINSSREELLAALVRIHREAWQGIPVLDAEGKPTGQFTPQLTPAIESLRLISDLLGYLPGSRDENNVPDAAHIKPKTAVH